MNKNCENKMIFSDNIYKICQYFIDSFEYAYCNINERGKRYLLWYINSFFRRWIFTSLIQNLELSPANIIYEGNDHKMALPVIINKSKSRIGILKAAVVDYSIESSPVISDIKKIYELAENGIKANDDDFFDEDFYKKYSHMLNIDDPDYLSYIIYIAIRLGILNIMPSIGITMICRGSDKLLNTENKRLFDIIINEAIAIAAEKLSEFSLTEEKINPEDITLWLKEERNVDSLFNRYLAEPEIEDFIINDRDDYYNYLENYGFEKGIAFDKWFLTPFGYYFGIIMPEYTSEFNLFNEMEMLMDTINYSFDSDISLMLYSPCTQYWLTDIGCEYFSLSNRFKGKYIFKSFSPESIANMLVDGSLYNIKEEMVYNYYPPFNVYNMRISWTLKRSVWFDVNLSEYFSLDELGRFVIYCLLGQNIVAKSYRFYTEPESPFTEYIYPKAKGSSNVYNTYLHNIFENRNTLMFNVEIELDGINCSFDFRIDLKNVFENTWKTVVPQLLATSKNFKEIFYL